VTTLLNSYWHTLDNKYEVDAVIGDAEVAVEVKSSKNIDSSDTKGLRAFEGEYPSAKLILLSLEDRPRKLNNIEIWPVCDFLQRLWANKIIKRV
jgi:predicted AAA+ superfamily ATPase